MDSIVACLKHFAEKTPDKTAIVADNSEITYGSLWTEVRGFASYLQSFGFQKGARIVVKAFPNIGYAVACFGCHLAGYVFAPIEKSMGAEGVLDIVETLDASMLISDNAASVRCAFTNSTDVRAIAAEHFNKDLVFSFPSPTDLCDILFTTGTTGKSKGVVLSHKAVYAAVDNNKYADRMDDSFVYQIAVPINHANGIRKFYCCLISGATAVLLDGFMNVKLFYQTMQDYKTNALLLPPSAVRVLLTVSAKELARFADQIKVVHSGSSAMPESDKETLIKLLPHSRLIFGYGASEAGNSCAYDYAKYPGLSNCVGKANPHIRVFIVDDDGKEIQSSKEQLGLIALSGDTLMEGYYNAPELTAEVLRDGVLYTNDIGYIDENGFVFMLARKGDVINVGGLKIAPSEVENVVMRYPGVSECACFGIPDKLNGYVPKLNIVPEADGAIDLVDFRKYLQTNLEAFKIPKQIVFVESLPKTSNGKLDRKQLQ